MNAIIKILLLVLCFPFSHFSIADSTPKQQPIQSNQSSLALKQPTFVPTSYLWSLAEAKTRDTRLNQKITDNHRRICIGELLEEISKQTGITILADTRSGAADIEISCYLEGQPVGQVMDTLWSLVSHQGGEWKWIISKDVKGAYVYTLIQPTNARNIGERLLKGIQEELIDQTEEAIQYLDQPDKLKELAKEDKPNIKNLFDPISGSEMMGQLRTFSKLLNKSERRDMIMGKMPPREFPMASLSASERRYADQVIENSAKLNPTLKTTGGKEDVLIKYYYDKQQQVSSGVMIGARSGDIAGGGAVVGSVQWNALCRKKIYDLWILPEDKAEGEKARLEYIIPENKKEPASVDPMRTAQQGLRSPSNPLEMNVNADNAWKEMQMLDYRGYNTDFVTQRLAFLAVGHKLPIMIVLHPHLTDPGKMTGISLEKALQKITGGEEFFTFIWQAKWRNGMLLIQHSLALQSPPRVLPWVLKKQVLTHLEAENDNFCTWEDFFYLTTLLTSEQIGLLNSPYRAQREVSTTINSLRQIKSAEEYEQLLNELKNMPPIPPIELQPVEYFFTGFPSNILIEKWYSLLSFFARRPTPRDYVFSDKGLKLSILPPAIYEDVVKLFIDLPSGVLAELPKDLDMATCSIRLATKDIIWKSDSKDKDSDGIPHRNFYLILLDKQGKPVARRSFSLTSWK